jgi:hypothetical protein
VTERVRYPTKAVIARAIEAARACGLDVAGVAVSPDGTVRTVPANAAPATAYDRWKQEAAQ